MQGVVCQKVPGHTHGPRTLARRDVRSDPVVKPAEDGGTRVGSSTDAQRRVHRGLKLVERGRGVGGTSRFEGTGSQKHFQGRGRVDEGGVVRRGAPCGPHDVGLAQSSLCDEGGVR